MSVEPVPDANLEHAGVLGEPANLESGGGEGISLGAGFPDSSNGEARNGFPKCRISGYPPQAELVGPSRVLELSKESHGISTPIGHQWRELREFIKI